MSWETDIENLDDLSKKTKELVFKLASDKLSESVKTFSLMSTGSYIAISINIAFVTALSGYYLDNQPHSDLLKVVAVLLILLLIGTGFFLRNLWIYNINTIGVEPEEILLKKKLVIEGLDKNKQFGNLLVNLSEAYQDMYEENRIINSNRATNYRVGLVLLLLVPLLLVTAFLCFNF